MRGIPKNQWWPVLLTGPVRDELDLNTVFGFRHGGAWAAGDQGTILYRSPSGVWSHFSSSGEGALRCAWGPAAEAMVIGGVKIGGKNLLQWRSPEHQSGHWEPATLRGLMDITTIFGRAVDEEELEVETFYADSSGELVQKDLDASDGTWRTSSIRYYHSLPMVDRVFAGAVTAQMMVVVMSEDTFWRRRLALPDRSIPGADSGSWGPWERVELAVSTSAGPQGRALRFNAAWADAQGTVWLAGDHGAVARWTDTSGWAVATSLGYRDLFAVHGTGPDDVWVAGDGGAIYRWNGTSWKLSSSKVSAALFGLWACPELILAVGENHTILEFRRV